MEEKKLIDVVQDYLLREFDIYDPDDDYTGWFPLAYTTTENELGEIQVSINFDTYEYKQEIIYHNQKLNDCQKFIVEYYNFDSEEELTQFINNCEFDDLVAIDDKLLGEKANLKRDYYGNFEEIK